MRTRHRHPKRSRQDRYLFGNGSGLHHFFFSERAWELGAFGCLRCHPYCSLNIPNALHTEIHRLVARVPLPEEQDCRNAYAALKELIDEQKLDTADPITHRLEVLASFWRHTSPDTAFALDKERRICERYYEQLAQPSADN